MTQRTPNGATAYRTLVAHRGPALAATHTLIAGGAGAAAVGWFSQGKPIQGSIFAGAAVLQTKFAAEVTRAFGASQRRNGEFAEAARWSGAAVTAERSGGERNIFEIAREYAERDSGNSSSRGI